MGCRRPCRPPPPPTPPGQGLRPSSPPSLAGCSLAGAQHHFCFLFVGPAGKYSIFGGLGGPGGPGNHSKRWGVSPPTCWKGFRGRRGPPEPNQTELATRPLVAVAVVQLEVMDGLPDGFDDDQSLVLTQYYEPGILAGGRSTQILARHPIPGRDRRRGI